MPDISFYNLDSIIELNEKRLEQYSAAYQKNLDKFTNILIIYSGVAVFLVPLIQSLFFADSKPALQYIFFFLFCFIFGYSLVYTIKLLIPVEIAHLIPPKTYYVDYRLHYEAMGKDQMEADNYIKASYIDELQKAVDTNNDVFKRKGLFYYRALSSALIAVIPYLFCLGYHFSEKNDNVQKVEIINMQEKTNFNKKEIMSDTSNNNSSSSSPSTTNTTTQLPNINPSDVKPSNPQLIKENFQEQTKKPDSGNKDKK